MSSVDDKPTVEYRPIPGLAGYRVGDDGSVWTCRRGSKWQGVQRDGQWRKMKGHRNSNGYIDVTLQCNGRGRHYLAHRLVLWVFVGPCPPGMVAAHRNSRPDDNRLGNLRWDTQAGNLLDKHANGTWQCGEKHGNAKLTTAIVLEIRRLRATGMFQRVIGEQLGVNPITVQAVCARRLWNHIA